MLWAGAAQLAPAGPGPVVSSLTVSVAALANAGSASTAAIPASRILANTPSAHGCCGLTTGLPHTLTLGCGTWGGNSTTNNVTHADLRNVKRLALPLHQLAG